MLPHGVLHLLGGDFSIVMGNPQHLVAGGFHGTGLVDIDVSGVRTQCSLVGAQGGINHSHIGLGSAHQKMDGNILPATFLPDFGGGSSAIRILAIAGGLHHIDCKQPLHHLFMAAFAVIVVKINHRNAPLLTDSILIIAPTENLVKLKRGLFFSIAKGSGSSPDPNILS